MHRHAAVGVIILAAIPICVLAWADARGEWARAQLASATDAQWPGYDLSISRTWGSEGEGHELRVRQDGELVFEKRFILGGRLLGGGSRGFVASLNADSDHGLEIVHCDAGVVQTYLEPGWQNIGVDERHGTQPSLAAKEVCAAYVQALDWTDATLCFLVCVAPAALPLGALYLYRRRRERAQTKRSGPLSF